MNITHGYHFKKFVLKSSCVLMRLNVFVLKAERCEVHSENQSFLTPLLCWHIGTYVQCLSGCRPCSPWLCSIWIFQIRPILREILSKTYLPRLLLDIASKFAPPKCYDCWTSSKFCSKTGIFMFFRKFSKLCNDHGIFSEVKWVAIERSLPSKWAAFSG